MTKDLDWVKNEIAPFLINYEIQYRFFEEGDFGSLTQFIFNSSKKGGGIDFWGLGWLGIDIYDYENDKQLLNILLKPEQEDEKNEALESLRSFLK